MSRRDGKRDGNAGRRTEYGGGPGDNATNYAPSVGTPTGRMNEKRGSTQIAGAPRDVHLGSGGALSLRGSGDSPGFHTGFTEGRTPGIPIPGAAKMPQTKGAGANASGANQAGGGGGFQSPKNGKMWANFRRNNAP